MYLTIKMPDPSKTIIISIIKIIILTLIKTITFAIISKLIKKIYSNNKNFYPIN